MSAPESESSISCVGCSTFVDELNQLNQSETDVELLEKYVQCRDRLAMERLIVRYGPMVYSVCRATASCRSDAEDAFQATFLVLIQSATKVRKQSSLAAWLHGVAYRTATRARLRSQRMRDQQTDASQFSLEQVPSDQIDPITLLAKQIELEWLFKELEQLPRNLKNALVEHYLHGFSAREISERMEISVAAVEGRLKRGRQMLRSKLIRHNLSLSVALGAVVILKRRVQAAESDSLVSQFCSQHLQLESMVQSPSSLSPNVSDLIQGEIAMMKNSLLAKATAFSVVFGSLGALTALAVWDSNDGASVANQSQDIVIRALPGELEASTTPTIVLGQGNQGQGEPTIPLAVPSSAVLAQSSPSTTATAQTVAAPNTNTHTETPNSAKNQQALGGGKGNGPAVEKSAPIVKWTAPKGDKPNWLMDETEDEKSRNRIKLAIRQATLEGFSFAKTPLDGALRAISESSNIYFYLNSAKLEEDGLEIGSEVTLELPPCSLREALELMLEPLGLAYRIHGFGIEITTQSDVQDQNRALRTYDLSYLYSDSSNVEALIKTVIYSIEPDSWAETGGSNSISLVGSLLVVNCPDSVHYRIEDLLNAIAKTNPGNSTPQVSSQASELGGLF